MKIDNNYGMEINNGYFVTYEIKIHGKDSKLNGQEKKVNTQTYHRLLTAYGTLKNKGVDGNKIMSVASKLIEGYHQKESKSFLADLERKKNL